MYNQCTPEFYDYAHRRVRGLRDPTALFLSDEPHFDIVVVWRGKGGGGGRRGKED